MAVGITAGSDFFSWTPTFTTVPFTVSCWVYAPTLNNRFVTILAGGVSDYHAILYLSGTVVARSFVTGDGSFNGQSTTTGFTASTWHHIAGVWTSTANRQVFLNGTAGTANTTSKSVASIGSASVSNSTGTHYIADLSIWNTALTQAEVSSLAKGFSGSRIRPASLQFHTPLVRGAKEIKMATALTVTGTPSAQPHPPIIGAIAS